MKRILFTNLLLAAAVGSAAVAADTNVTATTAVPVVTLDALVAEALERHPELQFYQAEIAAAKAGRKSAGLFANPELSTSIGQKSVRGGDLRAEGVAWSVSLTQPFEWPGRIGLRKAIANRDVELANLGLERFRAALAGRVQTLAFGMFAAQQKATAAREVADRFQALREVLVQRDPAGLTPMLETRVIEATELTLQRQASEAALARETALLELNQLRGVNPNAPLLVAPPDLTFRPVADVPSLVAMARTNNFELRQKAVELAQQGFRVDLAKNERYPAIAVGPVISEERAGERERVIGVGVSVPLPLWNRNGANIEVAKARQLQAEVLMNVTERETERNVIEASLTYETKLREMGKWRADAVRHFKEAAELADRHYRLGAVSISTYVELQKQYLEAVEALLETKKEALEAAISLQQLTGLPAPFASKTQEPQ